MTTLRTFFMVLLLVGVHHSARGQVLISILLGDKLNTGKIEFGLDGGVNFPTLRGSDGGEMKANFNLGFYFDFKLKNPQWKFHTGVLVKSTLGTDQLPVYSLNNPDLDDAFAEGSVRRKIQYFNVPVAMKYKFNNHFFVTGGLMAGLRHKATDVFTASVQSSKDLEYTVDTKKNYHPLDVGVLCGLGYRLLGGNGMNLAVRYYYGFVDVVIDDSSSDQYNTSLYLAVGIPIGAGKAKEKRE